MIIKMADETKQEWFFEWSHEWDAPVSAAMTLPELKRYLRRQAVAEADRQLERMLPRLQERGVSSVRETNPVEAIEPCNRAGAGETWLSAEEQLRLCIMRRDDPRAQLPGVPQDMVCCYCSKPIATQADRVWADPTRSEDPAHRRCHERPRRRA